MNEPLCCTVLIKELVTLLSSVHVHVLLMFVRCAIDVCVCAVDASRQTATMVMHQQQQHWKGNQRTRVDRCQRATLQWSHGRSMW